jgi:hypothetical protein
MRLWRVNPFVAVFPVTYSSILLSSIISFVSEGFFSSALAAYLAVLASPPKKSSKIEPPPPPPE